MTEFAPQACARGVSAPSASRAREPSDVSHLVGSGREGDPVRDDRDPPHRPMLACELEALRQEWRDVQEQITAALDARDLQLAVRLSERCRELDRIVFSQPLSFIQGRRR